MSDNSTSFGATTGGVTLPAPAGTDENGNPFWIISGQKLNWVQVQRLLAQHQSQQVVDVGAKGGIEALPQMPVVDLSPDSKPVDQALERAAEQAEKPKQTNQPNSDTGSAVAAVPADQNSTAKPTKPSYLGTGPKLSTVDTSNVASMANFVSNNSTQPPSHSKRFLAELLRRLLLGLSASQK